MDRQGARHPADLERKYAFGKSFAEVTGIAEDARTHAEEAKNAFEGLGQEEIFNRLTNNGQWEGIYKDGDNIYINASYIKAGELLADLIKAGILKSKGDSFYLDLDNGILKMSAKGYEVLNVGADGATIAGWQMNKDYFGSEQAGLNGSSAVCGESATGKTTGSTLRFFAGANDSTKRITVTTIGTVTALGYFQAQGLLTYMIADAPNPSVKDVIVNGVPLGTIALDPAQPTLFTKSSIGTLVASGKLSDAVTSHGIGGGAEIEVQVEIDSYIPAWQVLDDGTLIAKYAVVGGYNIADLVARIEALEKK